MANQITIRKADGNDIEVDELEHRGQYSETLYVSNEEHVLDVVSSSEGTHSLANVTNEEILRLWFRNEETRKTVSGSDAFVWKRRHFWLQREMDKRNISPCVMSGSEDRPLDSIQTALNLASGDSGTTVRLAAGCYQESICFCKKPWESIAVVGDSSSYLGLNTVIQGDILWKRGNENVKTIVLDGLHIKGDVVIDCPTQGSNAFLVDMAFKRCKIDGNVTFRNLKLAGFVNSKVSGSVLFENVGFCWIDGGPGTVGPSVTIRHDQSKPYSDGYSYCIVDGAVSAPITLDRVGAAGSVTLQARGGARIGWGSGAAVTLNAGCNFSSFGCTLRGSGSGLVNNGGTVSTKGAFFDNTGTDLTSQRTDDAIKELAARVAALESE